MRHRISGKRLSRSTSNRKAMRRNMAASLFEHGAVKTTLTKAKELKPFVERLITIARTGTLHARRRVIALLGDRAVADKETPGELADQTVVQLLFSDVAPRYPMIVLGAAFVLVPAALWPSVPLLVDKRMTGTAYGVLTQIQNIGLFAFPKANGWLRETTGDYQASQLMFVGLGVLALVFAFMLLRSDRKLGGVLERP